MPSGQKLSEISGKLKEIVSELDAMAQQYGAEETSEGETEGADDSMGQDSGRALKVAILAKKMKE